MSFIIKWNLKTMKQNFKTLCLKIFEILKLDKIYLHLIKTKPF
ncbi:hypothetical protein HPLT_00690 [Helicobacter pylori Lithuania75]|nr:hypothetical protein HPLT_00690 [Helicobacter pylori Lithuania75]